MNSDPNLFVCGFNDGYLSTFDIVKTQFTSNLKTFKIDKNDRHHHDKTYYQPNCLISGSLQTIYGGFEDATIKSCDFRSGIFTLKNFTFFIFDYMKNLFLLSLQMESQIHLQLIMML